MIEKTVQEYLKRTINVPVLMETGREPRKKYVRIEKIGSSKENHIKTAIFAIQSYAETLYQAAELNEDVKTAMDNITVLDEICKSDLNSDYNYTDTGKKGYRYQAVYDLVHY